MNDEIKEILDKLKEIKEPEIYITPKTTKKLLDYITNLQQENERLREELNGKQLREIHKINNYDYFKEMTNNWNREDFSRRCYDLCNEKVDYKSRIEKAVEYIMSELVDEWSIKNDGYVDGSDLPVNAITPILDILNGRGDE